VEIVIGFLALATFLFSTQYISDDQSWSLLGHAIRIGTELDINWRIISRALKDSDEKVIRHYRSQERWVYPVRHVWVLILSSILFFAGPGWMFIWLPCLLLCKLVEDHCYAQKELWSSRRIGIWDDIIARDILRLLLGYSFDTSITHFDVYLIAYAWLRWKVKSIKVHHDWMKGIFSTFSRALKMKCKRGMNDSRMWNLHPFEQVVFAVGILFFCIWLPILTPPSISRHSIPKPL